MLKNAFFALVTLVCAVQVHADDQTDAIKERAEIMDQYFFGGRVPPNYLDVNPPKTVPGARNILTVLPGVLYRGGGPGGKRQLSDATLTALCEAGFSMAVYAYDVPEFQPRKIHCGKNNERELDYIKGNAASSQFKAEFLKLVQDVVDHPDRGPIFEHCWNGMHASGELAAVALRQFCGWDGNRAGNYWLRHSGNYPLIGRIKTFTGIQGLGISEEDKAVLCQQAQ